MRLNPLTPRGGPERQLNLLYSVAAAALERPLTPEEKRAAQEALHVLERRSDGEPTLPAVVDVLIHPPGEMAEALAMPLEELAAATRPMAFALDQLCSGNLRGMFDGPTTPGLDLDAPLVVLNLRAVLNTQTTALGILMTCATAWLQAMIEAETDERSAKRIVVVDEAWRIVSNLGIGEWLQQSFKLSRGLGAQNVVVMHRLSDLRAVGAEGSREVRLAEGLLADAETKVIYAQPPDQLPQTRELLGLTDTEAELLPHLRRGWALWKVGQRSFLVQHRLSDVRARARRHGRAHGRAGRRRERRHGSRRASRSRAAEPNPLETLALRRPRRRRRASERRSGSRESSRVASSAAPGRARVPARWEASWPASRDHAGDPREAWPASERGLIPGPVAFYGTLGLALSPLAGAGFVLLRRRRGAATRGEGGRAVGAATRSSRPPRSRAAARAG